MPDELSAQDMLELVEISESNLRCSESSPSNCVSSNGRVETDLVRGVQPQNEASPRRRQSPNRVVRGWMFSARGNSISRQLSG